MVIYCKLCVAIYKVFHFDLDVKHSVQVLSLSHVILMKSAYKLVFREGRIFVSIFSPGDGAFGMSVNILLAPLGHIRH